MLKMSGNEKIKNLINKAQQKKFFLLCSLIYNFVWAVCKIVFGALSGLYFFCVSGGSTILLGFTKKVYLKNYKTDDLAKKRNKSINIAILLLVSSILFVVYMARLFFVEDAKEYGLILSIAIAAFSFSEFGISIYHFFKAHKTDDILLQSFKGCSLASSCFAIVLTQVALLSATGADGNLYNAVTGVIFGSFALIIGLYVLIKAIKASSLSKGVQVSSDDNTYIKK